MRFSSVSRRWRRYSTANRVVDASKEDVLVAEHLKEEAVERTPSHLMSSLASCPVSAAELFLVLVLFFLIHPGLVVVHSIPVYFRHVSFGEDGVGVDVLVALQMASSLPLDNL